MKYLVYPDDGGLMSSVAISGAREGYCNTGVTVAVGIWLMQFSRAVKNLSSSCCSLTSRYSYPFGIGEPDSVAIGRQFR